MKFTGYTLGLGVTLTCLLGLNNLAGCTGASRSELDTSSAISFSMPGFYLPPGSSLNWRSEVVYLFEDDRQAPDHVTPYLQLEIENYFQGRGNMFTGTSTAADYGMVAVIVLGDGMTAKTVLQEFRLTPSFQVSRTYEKGTIVVAIYDPDNEKVQWRGAIQANVDLMMAPEERRTRVRDHVRRLLDKVPARPPQ